MIHKTPTDAACPAPGGKR